MFRYIASCFKIHISHCQFSIVVCLMAGSSLMTPVSICLCAVAAVWAQTCHPCHTVKHGESSRIPLRLFPSIQPSNTSSNIPSWRRIWPSQCLYSPTSFRTFSFLIRSTQPILSTRRQSHIFQLSTLRIQSFFSVLILQPCSCTLQIRVSIHVNFYILIYCLRNKKHFHYSHIYCLYLTTYLALRNYINFAVWL